MAQEPRHAPITFNIRCNFLQSHTMTTAIYYGSHTYQFYLKQWFQTIMCCLRKKALQWQISLAAMKVFINGTTGTKLPMNCLHDQNGYADQY